MRTPMTIADFLDRAELGFGDGPAVVDEPHQPAPPVPESTYGRFAERVRAWQAGLDALGVGEGERVAVASHNSARLLELLFAVPMSGRICVPMFHCNGWGMPYVMAGLGVKQVVLRKVDGAEILRRVEEHGVTLMCGAPAVWNMVLDAAATWEGEIPGRDRVRIVCAGAPPPTKTIQRGEEEPGWEVPQL